MKTRILLSLLSIYTMFIFGINSLAQTNFEFPIFRVTTEKIQGKNSIQEEKMKKALLIFEKVMNDKSFQEDLQKLTFHFDIEDDPNRNLTTSQIVKTLYEAKEHYSTKPDNNAQIYWYIQKRNFFSNLFKGCSTIGYGEETEKEINTYTCFINRADLPELAGHISHEWSHKIGFAHKQKRHNRRNETVPYAFGYLVRKHAKKHFQ